jgi:putative cell wall-binding protein
MFRIARTRLVAVVAAVAVGTATFVAFNPLAQAATPCPPVPTGACTTLLTPLVSAPNPTSIFPGVAKQPAGDWFTDAIGQDVGVSNGTDNWVLRIRIDDNNSSQPPCTSLVASGPLHNQHAPSADYAVGFATTPTVTNLTVGNTAKFVAKLSSSPGACTTAHVLDTLDIVSTATGGDDAELQISGITYTVGKSVARGPIRATEERQDEVFIPNRVESNATVSLVKAASAAPGTLIASDQTSAPIPNVVVQETRAGSVLGGVCITLAKAPTGTAFNTSSLPVVVSNGGAGKGLVQNDGIFVSPDTIEFLTTTSATPTTYTVSNLNVTTAAADGPENLGPLDAVAYAPTPTEEGPVCAPPTADTLYTPNVRLGTVGSVVRIAGPNRYATAAQIAASFGDLSGKTVVIARGDNFPDALAASYLAGKSEVPILLTRTNQVPVETFAALRFGGATDVVLIGGTGAISSQVEAVLAATHTYDFGSNTPNSATLNVSRIGGVNRYQTARLVAESAGLDEGGTLGIRTDGGCSEAKTAILASGENFPDALAAGGLAYHGANADGINGCGSGPLPLLLTQRDGLPGATVAALQELGIRQILLLGGSQAVAPVVESALQSLPNVTVKRIAGSNRQETAIDLARLLLGPEEIGNWRSERAIFTRPDAFPDALTASALSGTQLAPIYLTESTTNLGDDVSQAILDYPVPTYVAGLIGGTEALSNDVATDLTTLIGGQPG